MATRKSLGEVSPHPYGGIVLSTGGKEYAYPSEVVVPWMDVSTLKSSKVEVLLNHAGVPVAFTSARGRYSIIYP
jgi:hypothetical protein